MHICEGLRLDRADVARREKAARHIQAMRDALATLEQFIASASAAQLSGNYYVERIETAELEVTRALRATTCEGTATIGRMELVRHGPG